MKPELTAAMKFLSCLPLPPSLSILFITSSIHLQCSNKTKESKREKKVQTIRDSLSVTVKRTPLFLIYN